jgi:DMSO/TMAO reductase YedYZ molybdopterin-dependent catalytic subunit
MSDDVRKELQRLTRRGFLTGAVAAGVTAATWSWLKGSERVHGAQWPLRTALNANESLARGAFDPSRLSPEFPRQRVMRVPRVNGHQGLTKDYDVAQWRMRIEGAAGADKPVEVGMDVIRSLPRQEMIYELRCIEGWSMVVKWTGARLSDLVQRYPPPTRSGRALDLANRAGDVPQYVSMATPDGRYYVGLDTASALHPQTLLVYAMNDAPLDWHHGAPLRLAIPVKYGIKNIKRIGTLRYTDVRPPDFWGDRGYDWYAGL